MDFVWGRYSGLFYTAAGTVFYWDRYFTWRLLVPFSRFSFFLFLVGLSDYLQKKQQFLKFSTYGRFRFILRR